MTGLAQIRRIDLAKAQAAGKDTASIQAALADTEKKLATNIAIVGFTSFLCMLSVYFAETDGQNRTREVRDKNVRRLTL